VADRFIEGIDGMGRLIAGANHHFSDSFGPADVEHTFACITMHALAGSGGYFAMDIPHNTAWQIK
jgi:hypothetical protein